MSTAPSSSPSPMPPASPSGAPATPTAAPATLPAAPATLPAALAALGAPTTLDLNALGRKLTDEQRGAFRHLEGRSDTNLDVLVQHLKRMLTQLERTDLPQAQMLQMVNELEPLFRLNDPGPDITLDARDQVKLRSIVVLMDAILSHQFPDERAIPEKLRERTRGDHITGLRSTLRSAYALCTGRHYPPTVVTQPSEPRRRLEAIRHEIVSAYMDGQPEGWSLKGKENIRRNTRKWVAAAVGLLGLVKGCEYGCSAVNTTGRIIWGGRQTQNAPNTPPPPEEDTQSRAEKAFDDFTAAASDRVVTFTLPQGLSVNDDLTVMWGVRGENKALQPLYLVGASWQVPDDVLPDGGTLLFSVRVKSSDGKKTAEPVGSFRVVSVGKK